MTVFDVYEGKGVPEGKKSVAVAVRIQPKDATLTEAEIEALAQKIVAAAMKLGATLRLLSRRRRAAATLRPPGRAKAPALIGRSPSLAMPQMAAVPPGAGGKRQAPCSS